MKIHYHCEQCGQAIDTLEVEQVDEAKLGFDALSSDERQQLIYHDALTNALYVQSLCDLCIESLGLENEEGPSQIVMAPVVH